MLATVSPQLREPAASILSRDGNGAGAPEKNLLECLCREKAECPGSNRSVTVAAQHAVFASTQTLVFIPPGWPQAICGSSVANSLWSYQSAYGVPSKLVLSDPLRTSQIPGSVLFTLCDGSSIITFQL